MLYNAFGRTTSRTAPEIATTYEYFTGTGGMMNDKLTKITAPNGVVEAYEYDNLSRLKKANKTIDGLVYSYSYEYDSYGNASKTTVLSGLVVNHNHDRNGITTSTTLAGQTRVVVCVVYQS